MGDPRRIEIDWGALEGFMESYEKLTQSFSGVSESFRKILRAMALINGGMGNTAPAADQLDSRLANYDRLREEAAANGRTMVEELLKDCKTNDEKVARLKLAQEYLHEAQLRDQKKLSELHEKLLNSEKELLDTKVSLVRNYVKALVLIDLDDQEAVNKIVNGSNDPRLREVAIINTKWKRRSRIISKVSTGSKSRCIKPQSGGTPWTIPRCRRGSPPLR